MSLPKSPPPVVEVLPSLEAALTEVAEQSFCGFVEPCTPDRFGELLDSARETGGAWLRAHLGFKGPFQGELTVDLPEPLAKSLLASCLGLDANDDSQFSPVVIEDGAGELANMICGTWLTRSYGSARFDLKPPRVERLAQQAFTVSTAATVATDANGVLLTGINDQPVRVGLSVQEG
jgi:hypothetical protein